MKIYKRLADAVFFGFYKRLFIEFYLMMCISAILTLNLVKPDSIVHEAELTLALILMTLIIILPLISFISILQNRDLLEN